jgi:EmrB/QacA subfamily drug resistance transporter
MAPRKLPRRTVIKHQTAFRRYGRVVADVRMGTAAGRWVIAAAAVGSGIAFLDGSIVNGALPAIRNDLGGSVAGQQWVVTAYFVTLGSLLVVGGSLGDRYGRRKLFMIGLAGFALASMLCGLAPSLEWLIAGRAVKGVAAAALVPGSLAIISSVFHPDDRARAIGSWSGLASISTAIGPFIGGWLIDAVSWRWVFLINPVLVVVPIVLALKFVPETLDRDAPSIDVLGGALLSIGLGGAVYSLIEGPSGSWPVSAVVGAIVGGVCLVLFVVAERTMREPMVPLNIFRSRQFTGANVSTFVIWGAIGTVFFLLSIHLQEDLGYSALEAGAATIPVTVLVALLASRGGALAQRIGARVPLAAGALTIAVAIAVLAAVDPGDHYAAAVLPGVLLFGLGLSLAIAPVTTLVLSAVDDRHAGIASAINNAVARIASLLVIAVIPALAGATTSIGSGYHRAMLLCAALAAIGATVAWLLTEPAQRSAQPSAISV